jgi:hypothetical protein
MSETKNVSEIATQVPRQIGVDERRRHDRFEAAFDVQVSMTNDAGRRVGADAWVRDVSASGLGLSCRESFAAGDIITVRAPGRSLQCEVRHSRPDGDMFTLGLELLSSSDATDIQGSLRELSRSLHFESRTESADSRN